MDKTAARHLAAIRSGQITKSNIIGIRKILSQVWRIRRGPFGNRCNARFADADAIMQAIYNAHPTVTGELHTSGLAVLRNRRYAKRWTERQATIIASEHIRFDLVDFIDVQRGHFVPVYRIVTFAGSFDFYNIPWQSATAYGLETGPQITE